MKIKQEHYLSLFNAVKDLPKDGIEEHRLYLISLKKKKPQMDLEMRFRWDLFWSIKHRKLISQELFDSIYYYAKDTHIDTALKKIVQELGLEK